MNIGLALGSGASRGWFHIGIIRALIDLGIVPIELLEFYRAAEAINGG